MNYKNVATSDHPALIVFLIDVSESMGDVMPGGQTRIEVVRNVLFHTIQEMVHRATNGGKIKPRYRVALLAYSEVLFDVNKGIKDISEIENEIPNLPLQTATEMDNAFRGVGQILENDLASWDSVWLEKSPAPMIIHISDGELTKDFKDPTEVAHKLMSLKVPDGNVLLTNIFISQYIPIPVKDPKQWRGYFPEESTGDEFGNLLLRLSSRIPDTYIPYLKKIQLNIQPGAKLMFPGINPEFIQAGFAMTGASSNVVRQRPVVPERRMGD